MQTAVISLMFPSTYLDPPEKKEKMKPMFDSQPYMKNVKEF